jgi:hypothetical protein
MNDAPLIRLSRWGWIGISLLMIVSIWVLDWDGRCGPLEAREWYRRHFWPDKRESLYIITDSPVWAYGEVRTCGRIADVGSALKNQRPGLEKEDLLNCAGWLPREEYVGREKLAVRFEEKGYDFSSWDCTKTPEGLICR